MFTNSNSSVNSIYNRANAATYAKNHATNATRNTTYSSFSGVGGDCTNFASQILHDGGGLPFVGSKGTNTLTGTWYYYGSLPSTSSNLNGRTYTWTGAHEYRTYWGDTDSGNGRHAYQMIKYSIADAYNNFGEINDLLWLGDQVQFADANAKTTHTVTVDDYTWLNTYVSQHSDSAGTWASGLDLKSVIKTRMDAGTASYVYLLIIKQAAN
jgi:hypothetical protein